MNSEDTVNSILLIGYGNPGRCDDGLGPLFADAISQIDIPNVIVQTDYQLQIEDAMDAAAHDVVILADASVSGSDVVFEHLEPDGNASFSTHSVSPSALMSMVKEHFNVTPHAYLLTMRGYEFNEYHEGLSEKAQANLNKAVAFLTPILQQRSLSEFDNGITMHLPGKQETCGCEGC